MPSVAFVARYASGSENRFLTCSAGPSDGTRPWVTFAVASKYEDDTKPVVIFVIRRGKFG